MNEYDLGADFSEPTGVSHESRFQLRAGTDGKTIKVIGGGAVLGGWNELDQKTNEAYQAWVEENSSQHTMDLPGDFDRLVG